MSRCHGRTSSILWLWHSTSSSSRASCYSPFNGDHHKTRHPHPHFLPREIRRSSLVDLSLGTLSIWATDLLLHQHWWRQLETQSFASEYLVHSPTASQTSEMVFLKPNRTNLGERVRRPLSREDSHIAVLKGGDMSWVAVAWSSSREVSGGL
ncbi:hypothetical protein DFS33DRAFT_646005 [Desarmillaria ectypa]|nr:hypothetical protein DFS33DRAFT_646005 [Desarmillaria ectypa]